MTPTAAHTASAPAPAATGPRLGPLLPARLRPLDRPRLWVELALTALGYWAYTLTRNAVPAHRDAALHRAAEIWHAERLLHVNIELGVNHAADRVGWLIVGMNYYYATLHFIVPIAVLAWLYVCHPARYRSARTALYGATLLALLGFAFCALAPPRFLAGPGFIDTVAAHHTHWARGPRGMWRRCPTSTRQCPRSTLSGPPGAA